MRIKKNVFTLLILTITLGIGFGHLIITPVNSVSQDWESGDKFDYTILVKEETNYKVKGLKERMEYSYQYHFEVKNFDELHSLYSIDFYDQDGVYSKSYLYSCNASFFSLPFAWSYAFASTDAGSFDLFTYVDCKPNENSISELLIPDWAAANQAMKNIGLNEENAIVGPFLKTIFGNATKVKFMGESSLDEGLNKLTESTHEWNLELWFDGRYKVDLDWYEDYNDSSNTNDEQWDVMDTVYLKSKISYSEGGVLREATYLKEMKSENYAYKYEYSWVSGKKGFGGGGLIPGFELFLLIFSLVLMSISSNKLRKNKTSLT